MGHDHGKCQIKSRPEAAQKERAPDMVRSPFSVRFEGTMSYAAETETFSWRFKA